MSKRTEDAPDHSDEEDFSRPFRVVVVEDLRDEEAVRATGRLDEGHGWCLGMYEYPDTTKKRPEGETRDHIQTGSEVLLYNPLIYTDSGNYIWGLECWYIGDLGWMKDVPPDVAREAVELQKQRLRIELGIDLEYSLN